MNLSKAALLALNTAITTTFNERFTGVVSTYGRIAMTVRSTTLSQAYPRMSELGPMREWIGERYVERIETNAFVVTNRKFEKTIAISVDDINDDQVGIYTPIVADMGQVAADLPDDLVWDQLEKGFAQQHYDGQFFFDADHPVVNELGQEVSVSNFGGGTGPAWYLIDDTRVLKPIIFQDREAPKITAKTSLTDDNVFMQDEFMWGAKRRCAAAFGAWQLIYASRQPLTAESYAAARAAMMSMHGHRGRKLNLRPKLLVVPPSLEEAALELLNAERNAAGATNVWRNTADLHVESRLTLI